MKVLDLDIDTMPLLVEGLQGYDGAYLLFRYRNVPLGTAWLPVGDGRLDLLTYADDITSLVTEPLSALLAKERLGIGEADPALPSSTIAICTRDRPKDLERCIRSLLQLPDHGQEILVVDNAPSTTDAKVLSLSFPIRYVLEPQAGLNNARNRALQEARGDVVVFIDDDAVADGGWLFNHLRHYQRSLVMCVTGMTLPLELETEGQVAFERYNPFSKGFLPRLFNALHDPLATGMIGAGANMSMRRSAYSLVGPFDPALDAGTPTKSGGDHEYFTRILSAGYLIMYEPAALNWHRHRRTMQETRATIYGYGVGVYAYWTKLLLQQGEWGILRIAWAWFSREQLKHLLKAILRRPNHKDLSLVWTEIRGCIAGPFAWYRSQKKTSTS